MSLIHNEQTKLTAGAINTLSTAMITVGVLAPTAAYLYGLSSAAIYRPLWQLLLSGLIWLLSGLVLHYAARTLLRRLKP
jgi:hypothetical protein